METQLAQIVNIGLAGEPEHAVLQVIDTLKIFEFSKIVDNTITNGAPLNASKNTTFETKSEKGLKALSIF